jgi:hypothetical protein
VATTTNGWAVLEALSTLGGSVVVAVGAVYAALYGRKANVDVEADAHLRPNGQVVVVVKASVSARGVRKIRIATEEGHVPTLRVTEVLDGEEGEDLHDGAVYEQTDAFAEEDQVGAGETVTKVVLFHQPPPTSNLVGWRVTFLVDVPKFLTFRSWWTWSVYAFVEVPTVEDASPGAVKSP